MDQLYYIGNLSLLYYVAVNWFPTSSFLYTVQKTVANDEVTAEKIHLWSVVSAIWIVDSVIPSHIVRMIWWYILLHPQYHAELSNIIVRHSKQFQFVWHKLNDHYASILSDTYVTVDRLSQTCFQDLKNKHQLLHNLIVSLSKPKQ